MKKLTALILAAVLVLSLAACGTANNAATDTQPTNAPSSAAPDASAAPSGKVLVVYYSASGNYSSGSAKDIADAAGADLFAITPTEVYSDDDLNWRNSDSRVSREHDDESLRDVPPDNDRGSGLGFLRHRVYRLSYLVGHCRVAC